MKMRKIELQTRHFPACIVLWSGRFPVRAPGPALFSVRHCFSTAVPAESNSPIPNKWWKEWVAQSMERAAIVEEDEGIDLLVFSTLLGLLTSQNYILCVWKFTEYLCPCNLWMLGWLMIMVFVQELLWEVACQLLWWNMDELKLYKFCVKLSLLKSL